MTVEEKSKRVKEYCCARECDEDCPLCDLPETACFELDSIKPEIVERNYKIIFGDENEPYNDSVNRPAHYTDGKIEVIEYIEDKKLGFCLGNAIKYISRAGKKDPKEEATDIRKAIWYLKRYLKELGYEE